MGRMMPRECKHGRIVDWGSFGAEDGSSKPEKCSECDIAKMPEVRLTEIVERIMTQHWDMAACRCWICEEGRDVGCRPRDIYMAHRNPEQKRETVHVDGDYVRWYPKFVSPE